MNLIDYLIKPIKIDELKEILYNTIHKIIKEKSLCFDNRFKINNNFIYDFNTQTLYDKSVEIQLTKNEIKLLNLFVKQSTIIIPIDEIFNYVWNDLHYSMTKLRSLINRLNQKLSHKIIESEYGIGYKLSK